MTEPTPAAALARLHEWALARDESRSQAIYQAACAGLEDAEIARVLDVDLSVVTDVTADLRPESPQAAQPANLATALWSD